MQKILRKRIFRDLKENQFRYLALALLVVFGMYIVIGLVGAADTVIIRTAERAKANRAYGKGESFPGRRGDYLRGAFLSGLCPDGQKYPAGGGKGGAGCRFCRGRCPAYLFPEKEH